MSENKKPNFCPNCGNPLVDERGWIQGYYIEDQSKSFTDWDEVGYDCYCDSCQWSGNIESDYKIMKE